MITDVTLIEITQSLTMLGLEVKLVIDRSVELQDFTIAEIINVKPHPDATKLQICDVYTGQETLQIICGAPNVRAGIKVVLAKIGSKIPDGQFIIKETKIRGIVSQGMLCSEQELLIGNNNSGIVELPVNLIVGDSFAKAFGYDDPIIQINVTPNRGDCLGVYGIARELAAKNLGKLQQLNSNFNISDGQFYANIKLDVIDKSHCPLFIATEIQDIDNNCETPLWLQNFLRNIGLRSISPIVDVTNYICYSFGYPIHVYDKDKLSNTNLEVKELQICEKFIALDGKNYQLEVGDLVVNCGSEVIGLAGIIGSLATSCSLTTKRLVLETAWFYPEKIMSTGRRLNIETDARYRFERGIDYNIAVKVHAIARDMIISICGGKFSRTVTCGDINVPTKSLNFQIAEFEKKTGIKLTKDTIKDILTSLEFKIVDHGHNSFKITIPSWRPDISIKEDIVEEILRVYGYNNLPEIPISCQYQFNMLSKQQRRILLGKRITASCGYNEVVTWSFINSEIVRYFGSYNENLKILNPINKELNYMRCSIIPNLLDSIAKNQARSIKNLAFFEIGPVFYGLTPEDEQYVLTAVKCGDVEFLHPHNKIRKWDIFDIKADLEVIISELGINIDNCKIVTDSAKSYYHSGRSGTVMLGKTIIGYFGEIHPKILDYFKINCCVVAMEVNIDLLPEKKLNIANEN